MQHVRPMTDFAFVERALQVLFGFYLVLVLVSTLKYADTQSYR